MSDHTDRLREELLCLKNDFNERIDKILSELEDKQNDASDKTPEAQTISFTVPIQSEEELGVF